MLRLQNFALLFVMFATLLGSAVEVNAQSSVAFDIFAAGHHPDPFEVQAALDQAYANAHAELDAMQTDVAAMGGTVVSITILVDQQFNAGGGPGGAFAHWELTGFLNVTGLTQAQIDLLELLYGGGVGIN